MTTTNTASSTNGMKPVVARTGRTDQPAAPARKATPPSKLDTLEKLLTRKNGATIAEMVKATGWQQHSVRGALAGAMKKRGHTITSNKVDGTRRYRIVEAEQ